MLSRCDQRNVAAKKKDVFGFRFRFGGLDTVPFAPAWTVNLACGYKAIICVEESLETKSA